MNTVQQPQADLHSINENLARAFYANGRYNPHFLGVTGAGFVFIYLLTRFGIFGQPAIQLFFIGLLTLLLAGSQVVFLEMARRNRGITANFGSIIATGVFATLLTYFWEGILPFSIAITLILPFAIARARLLPRRYTVLLLFLVLFSLAAVLYTDAYSTFNRLQNSTPAAMASLSFLIATGLLLVSVILVSQNRNFKSLRTLLLSSFILIVTIPTIMAAILSAIGAFTNSQSQTYSTLVAVSSLKENQIRALIHDSENDALTLQNDSAFALSALNVLSANTDNPRLEDSKRIVRSRVQNTIGGEEKHYTEIMVLNTQGDVVVSTIPENEGMNFEDQLFFRQGTLRFYTGFSEVPSFGTDTLVVATPIYDADGRIIRGVLILRSDASVIEDIMETTIGFESAETYLVDKNFKPVTKTFTPSETVRTQASLDAVLNNVAGTQTTYENYAGETVLGYYKWFDVMQVAFISEVPLSYVALNSARSLIGSAILALFVISIAIAAVAFSARSIVHPITALAQTTQSFAAGKLSARAPVDRADEIGALARSYNQMATQLQEVIGGLEKRVNERTQDLESQSLRLRIAAEIATETASLRDLKQLLEHSAQLIQHRFRFDHVGIFLLDNNRDYAVLVASPSEAGKRMIANSHKLRVGEVGLVGRVAASGEPRISLNTEIETAYYNNPFLPDTRSEMALPLKAEKNVIGVLDIQSKEPDSFSEDDIAIMQIMADQLATSIERTRLLQEVESNLKELESAYGQYTKENWKRLAEGIQSGRKGYRFDNIRIESITEISDLEKTALETGKTASSNGHGNDRQTSVAIPVKLRGQTIGVINVKLKENYGEETVSTIELASERLAAALESARLYEEARLRADREQSISQVTSAISASTSFEEILQTTVREIGTTLRDAEVTIQITGNDTGNRQNE